MLYCPQENGISGPHPIMRRGKEGVSEMPRMAIVTGLPALAVALAAGPMSADVVFNSFGPGNTYLTTGGWVVAGSAVSGTGGVKAAAMLFVPTADYYFHSLELVLAGYSGPNIVKIALMADGGNVPGLELESWTLTNAMGGTSGALVHVNSTSNPLLSNNTNYWVAAFPVDNYTYAKWLPNPTGMVSTLALGDEGDWTLLCRAPGVFRVVGHPGSPEIPEWSSPMLALAAGLPLGVARMRQKTRR